MNNDFNEALASEERAAAVTTPASAKQTVYTTFRGLGALKPESEDETVLFKGNWLGQGGGLLLTAPSGVGKSSLVIQAAMAWSLGKTFLATPNGRALKCSLVQSEDSKRDLQEIRDGMIQGFNDSGWTQEEIDTALDRVHIWNAVGKTGDTFIDWLCLQQQEDPVDIIIINPIQGFFGGDVAKQEDVSHFLRDGLDRILKGVDGHLPCATVLVQHTPKISGGTKKEGGTTIDEYSEYLGAGSHEWTDWARGKLVFLKKRGSESHFDLKAAKRGKRLGWIGSDGNPTTRMVLAHTDGYIFWRIVTDPAEIARLDAPSSKPEPRIDPRKQNDKGPKENLETTICHVDACIKTNTVVTNQSLRKWAYGFFPKDAANAAVRDFEDAMASRGFVKVDKAYQYASDKHD